MEASEFREFGGMPVVGRIIGKPCKQISDFLTEHKLTAPLIVQNRPVANARPLYCFQNAEYQVKIAGGRMETGWTFFELEGISIYTIAHAIWVTSYGLRTDITPNEFIRGKHVLFLPDSRVSIKRGYSAGYRSIISKDPRIVAMELFDGELDKIFDEYYPGLDKEFEIPRSRFVEAAERFGLPLEVAKERIDYRIENAGH